MKFMGIDYGAARTGISISDETGQLAGTPIVVTEWNQDKLLDKLSALALEHRVDEIVIGYPKNMDGSIGERAEQSAALADALHQKMGIPVVLWDERRTTIAAHQILHNNGKREKKHRQIIDAVAAAIILQNYLDFKNRQ